LAVWRTRKWPGAGDENRHEPGSSGTDLAFTEGVLPAEKSGIPRATAVDVLLNTIAASPMLQYRGSFVLKKPDEAWFNVNMMQKDMLHALEPVWQVDVPLPTTSLANEILTPARAMRPAERDFAIIFQVLERTSGVSK
jgi:3-hydroxyisobutyrate dehydrogenase-like beta-hydroxyacid dehydrogenase